MTPNLTLNQAPSLPPKSKKILGRLLVQELLEMGVSDAHLDHYGYVYATIPANTDQEKCPQLSVSVRIWTPRPMQAEKM